MVGYSSQASFSVTPQTQFFSAQDLSLFVRIIKRDFEGET